MDIPSALTKDEEHPGFYSASYPGASNMIGIIAHESPTYANRSKASSRSWVEEPASSPVAENLSTSLSSFGESDDSASRIALASKPSNSRPPSIAEFLAASQDLNIPSEHDASFNATSYAERDSLSDVTPRAELNNPFVETPRFEKDNLFESTSDDEKDNPFESTSDDEMNRRRFSLPLGSPFKSERADDTSKKARRFSIFSPGLGPRTERATGQSNQSENIEAVDDLERRDTLYQSLNGFLPLVRDFGDHHDAARYPVVSLSPGRCTISRQSAAIYGIPPTSGNLRTVSDGCSTNQDGNRQAMLPDHDPIASLHPATASGTKQSHPAAIPSRGFQRPENWFHQGLVDDDAYCTRQDVKQNGALDTCSTDNDVLHSSSPKSSYTLKRPQPIIPKQSRAAKASEQIPKRGNREPDLSTNHADISIANIDLEFLARPNLSAKQKEKYLDAAIATAKHVANTFGLPLMILKDYKSDVVVLKKQQAKWLAGASDWKARVLAEAETTKDKHAITELQQLGMLSQTQKRTLSLPAITTQPGVGIPPSTASPNQRPQTLSKAHEILGLTTPTRQAPVASPKRLGPRASPRYQHKPFQSSRSPDMVKLREDARNESLGASPANKSREKGKEEESEVAKIER